MNFKDIANIISSRSGIVIDSLIKEDLFNSTRGMSMQNIFDYIELGPTITNTKKVPDSIKEMMKNINSTNTTNSSSSITPENNSTNNSSNIPNFDPQTINQIKNIKYA